MTATKSFVCECNQVHSIETDFEPTRIKVYCNCGISHQVISMDKGLYVFSPKKNNTVKSKYKKIIPGANGYAVHTTIKNFGPAGPLVGQWASGSRWVPIGAPAKTPLDRAGPIEPPKEKIGEEKSKETDHESGEEDDESGEEDYESEKENTCDFANLVGDFAGHKMCPRPVQEDTGGTYCELHEVLNKCLCLDDFPEKNTKGPGKKDRWSLFFKEGF